MPSFQDSAVIFFLALLLFGPKKLPELARQLGKLMGEFRRASNEFRMQMEDELRASEQAEQQKKIAEMQAAAPVTPAIPEVSSVFETSENTIAQPSEVTDGFAADLNHEFKADPVDSSRTASDCNLRRTESYAAIDRPSRVQLFHVACVRFSSPRFCSHDYYECQLYGRVCFATSSGSSHVELGARPHHDRGPPAWLISSTM